MNEAIWKFPLEVTQSPQILLIPKGAKLLFIAMQEGKICLWMELEQSAEKERRKFIVVGTGWELPPDRNYCGTVLVDPYVWHVFENRRIVE